MTQKESHSTPVSGDVVKVRITASARVRYSQIAEIPAALWQKYEAMCERNARDRDFTNEFEHLLHPDSALSDDVTDIEMEEIA